MLPASALKPRKRNSPRPAWKVAEAFKQWLRGRPCACGGVNDQCSGVTVAAHVDHAGGKGIGTKVADRHCIPLSWGCHDYQHRIGWHRFEVFLPGKDAVAMAEAYWKAWPGRAKWEADHG